MNPSDQNDDELPSHWDLGALISVRPEAVLTPGTTDELEDFVLALALIFSVLPASVLGFSRRS
jgi:hypothetical protein